MDERAFELLGRIAETLAEAVARLESIERELARVNEQLADIRSALYS